MSMTQVRKLVSKKELRSVHGIPYSFAHIARLEKAGLFPKRLMLGACRVAWWEDDESATKRRETADFDRPDPAGDATSPSGSRTERLNLRVDTLISIWIIAHLPSQSSATAASQLGSARSLLSNPRSRGRSISIMPPWKPILPFVLPQRCA